MLGAIAYSARDLKDQTQAISILKDALVDTKHMSIDEAKAYALREIGHTFGKLNELAQALPVLKNALTATASIDYEEDKAYVLRWIAPIYEELKTPNRVLPILKDALAAAERIDYTERERAEVLQEIAHASNALADPQVEAAGLSRTLTVAQQNDASRAIRTIAEIYAKQDNWGLALMALQGCAGDDRIYARIDVLTVWAEQKNPKLIEGAVVLKVESDNSPSPNILAAEIDSPDEDCDQYADWWEVLAPDGTLIQRQVIAKPHPDDQSFTSEMKLTQALNPTQTVLIRAHFHGSYDDEGRSGYTDQALRGSVARGFRLVRPSSQFAAWLDDEGEQPPECVD